MTKPHDSPDPLRTTPQRLAAEVNAVSRKALALAHEFASFAPLIDDNGNHAGLVRSFASVAFSIGELATAIRFGRCRVIDQVVDREAGRGELPLLDAAEARTNGAVHDPEVVHPPERPAPSETTPVDEIDREGVESRPPRKMNRRPQNVNRATQSANREVIVPPSSPCDLHGPPYLYMHFPGKARVPTYAIRGDSEPAAQHYVDRSHPKGWKYRLEKDVTGETRRRGLKIVKANSNDPPPDPPRAKPDRPDSSLVPIPRTASIDRLDSIPRAARRVLAANGIRTIAELETYFADGGDLTDLPGMRDSWADSAREALEAHRRELDDLRYGAAAEHDAAQAAVERSLPEEDEEPEDEAKLRTFVVTVVNPAGHRVDLGKIRASSMEWARLKAEDQWPKANFVLRELDDAPAAPAKRGRGRPRKAVEL